MAAHTEMLVVTVVVPAAVLPVSSAECTRPAADCWELGATSRKMMTLRRSIPIRAL